MIVTKISEKPLIDQVADCYALVCEQDKIDIQQLHAIASQWCPQLQTFMQEKEFIGKKGQLFSMPIITGSGALAYVVVVGLGARDAANIIDIETYRRALGSIVKYASAQQCASIAFCMPSNSMFGHTVEYIAQQTATILNMANYRFVEYKTDEESKKGEIFEVTVCIKAEDKDAIATGLKKGECIAQAVNKARHWIDLPPTDLTPPHLADKALEIAKNNNIAITVFEEKQIIKMGMGGLAGVSRGSDLDCRLLIMEYRTSKKNAPTVAFVGKGITFDSGGLSLKPALNMEAMKDDMSGAAAVIAAMEAISILKPDVNVIGFAPLAENLPSGKATKPGDILRFYNGKTAEVKNTDAEGRLILADALSYAVKEYKPDAIIDIATLTGACAYALGPFYSGLMSQHDGMVERIERAAYVSGDHVWRLPFHDDYEAAIKSDVADLCNIGNPKYMAGAITAGRFLKHFVGDTPWAHLDIAGTAFNVPDISYYKSGATGVGVRLIIELALSWK